MSRTNKDRYNPVPHDHEVAGHRIMSTPEGRQAWADASEEFAIIDAMLEAVEKSGLSQAELADRMGTTQ